MQIKRRMFSRTVTVEHVVLNALDLNEELSLASSRKIQGGRFSLQIFRSGGPQPEMLFACDLQGEIEIEQTHAGDFTLVCKQAIGPEQKMIGD